LNFEGVLTGSGKQNIGAAVNLGAFYLLGIPMAVLLAFVFHLNGMVKNVTPTVIFTEAGCPLIEFLSISEM
jgi:Na+-driven multidrug efflux pump